MFELIGSAISSNLAVFGLPGHWEIVIVLVAILLLFGGRKLPELARGLGRGLRIFKREVKGLKDDVEGDEDQEQVDSHERGESTEQDKEERPG
jgi:sec-independent protein translocase protein TatA